MNDCAMSVVMPINMGSVMLTRWRPTGPSVSLALRDAIGDEYSDCSPNTSKNSVQHPRRHDIAQRPAGIECVERIAGYEREHRLTAVQHETSVA